MTMNKLIQSTVRKYFITIYVISILFFISIRCWDFYREYNRYFNLTVNYIIKSSEQMINEGESIRLQMHLDQFIGQINNSESQSICPEIKLEGQLIAQARCHSSLVIHRHKEYLLPSQKKLQINFGQDIYDFLISNIIALFLFSTILIIIILTIKNSLDRFTQLITDPLGKWSLWLDKIDFEQELVFPEFSKEELEIDEINRFNNFNHKAFKLQKEYTLSKIKEKEALAEMNLAKSVSHDIRSPLATLNSLINRVSLSDRDELHIFEQSIQKINSISNELLKKSTISENNQPQNILENLTNLVKGKLVEYQSLESHLQIQLQPKSDFSATILNTKEHHLALERILSNLINNSIEASALKKVNPTIQIIVTCSKKSLEIEIIDNGPGLPKEVVNAFGDKPISLNKENSSQSGSGLGLYTARQMLQKFGGDIFLINNSAEGCHIALKISQQTPDTILLLDDEKLNHLHWKNEAKKQNIELISFFNSKELITFLKENPKYLSHFIFLDYELNNENGLEVAKELSLLGANCLYLQSGNTPKHLPSYIRNSLDKSFPF